MVGINLDFFDIALYIRYSLLTLSYNLLDHRLLDICFSLVLVNDIIENVINSLYGSSISGWFDT